jgi:hypothetical protein
MLINHLPKSARNVIFVLGFSMVTMAGFLDQAVPWDQSGLLSKTAECPAAKPGNVKGLIPGP